MERASRRESVALSSTTTHIEHRTRRLYGSKAPAWELLCKMRELRARSDADTQNFRLGRQPGEHRLQQKMQPITNGRQLCPLLVVPRGLLIECSSKFIASHRISNDSFA